jgi:tetratricopeptide (TPR) repeat protein
MAEKFRGQRLTSTGNAQLGALGRRVALGFSFLWRRKAPLLQAILMILVGWWIYGPVLHGDWIGDDNLYVAENPLLNDPWRIWKAWFQPGSFIEYYPLQETVQWLQWKLWGDDTFGYHVTNVVLHLVSALLLWRLLLKFRLRLAWVGALIFVLHPVMVESVAWIAELKNTLSLPFALLAMCAWIDYEEHGRSRDYWLAWGLFLSAMLCKITLAMFPIVLLLYAWWKRDKITWRDLKASAPFFIISLTLSLISIWAGQGNGHVSTAFILTPHLGGFFFRMALAGLIISFYFTKSLVPIHPSSAYYEWTVDPHQLWQFLPWLVLLAVTYWLWTQRYRWGRHALLGLGFFLINLAPFLGFISVSYMTSSWVYDHLLYLPIIGLIGLAAAGLGRLDILLAPPARLGGRAIFALLLALLALESHDYAKLGINEEVATRYNIKLNPQNELIHCTLGDYLEKKGRTAEAIVQYREALALDPKPAPFHYALGNALAHAGQIDEAMVEYQKTLQIAPDFAEARNDFGIALAQKGRTNEAIAQFQKALEINPDLTQVHNNLGVALFKTGHWDEAIAQFQDVVRLRPHDGNARINLANAQALAQKARPSR